MPALERPLDPIVVIPCSGMKAAAPAAGTALPARELYTGPFHKLCRQAAEMLAGPDGGVVVLSALYGFVLLHQAIAPYELRMGQPGSIQPQRLRAQAAQVGILPGSRPVIALGGRAYTDAVAALRPDVLRPLVGCRGIGEQRSRLSRIIRAGQPLRLAEEFAAAARAHRQSHPTTVGARR